MKPTPDGKLEPIWYALGGVLAVPFCVVAIMLTSLLLLAAWPALPFVLYAKRKEEIAEAVEKKRKDDRDAAIEAIKRGGIVHSS